MKIFLKVLFAGLLCFYLIILTKLILFKHLPITEVIHHLSLKDHDYRWQSNNFIPFKTIIFYLFLADINMNIRIDNLLGNVIGFVPLGVMLPLLSKRFFNLITMMFAASSLSLGYELFQLLYGLGSFDIDDIILNTAGGVLGYLLIRLFYFVRFRGKQ